MHDPGIYAPRLHVKKIWQKISFFVLRTERPQQNRAWLVPFHALNFDISSWGSITVVVVITPPLPRDGGTARMAIQVHAVDLIEIRLGKRWHRILNQSWLTGSPISNKVDCH